MGQHNGFVQEGTSSFVHTFSLGPSSIERYFLFSAEQASTAPLPCAFHSSMHSASFFNHGSLSSSVLSTFTSCYEWHGPRAAHAHRTREREVVGARTVEGLPARHFVDVGLRVVRVGIGEEPTLAQLLGHSGAHRRLAATCPPPRKVTEEP